MIENHMVIGTERKERSIFCDYCGNNLDYEPYFVVDNEYYCESCFHDNFEDDSEESEYCENCGDLHPTFCINGEYLCEDCAKARCAND